MKRKKLSEELKANIILDWEKRSIDKAKIARKFGISDSEARRVLRDYRKTLKNKDFISISKDFAVEFQKVEPPDEHLQSAEDKIAFYKAEAEKYKALAKNLEKKEKILLSERKIFFAKQVEKCLENHEIEEIDGKWKMSHDEFMDFFSTFGDFLKR